MPFSNRMALVVLAARLVDGGGKPTKVWPPLVLPLSLLKFSLTC